MREANIMNRKKCCECGSYMKIGCEYTWKNKFLGEFSIFCNENEYYYCSCGEELMALSLLERVEQEEQKRVEQLLLNSVDCDFEKYKNELIPCNELGKVLGISRQAISKNRRIKTLMYKVVINNETFYWRESAILFKKYGDGRFDLRKHQSVQVIKTIKPQLNKKLFMPSTNVLHISNYVAMEEINLQYQNPYYNNNLLAYKG